MAVYKRGRVCAGSDTWLIEMKCAFPGPQVVFNDPCCVHASFKLYIHVIAYNMTCLLVTCLQANPLTGSLGTSGRQCERSSPGTEGCGIMCCGRGYNVQRSRATERCHCKFQWCCYVRCKTCERFVDVHTCK